MELNANFTEELQKIHFTDDLDKSYYKISHVKKTFRFNVKISSVYYPFLVNVSILYPLKTTENQKF